MDYQQARNYLLSHPEALLPGYHMNKRHWNTLVLNGDVPTGEIERMMDRSYGLVVRSLKK